MNAPVSSVSQFSQRVAKVIALATVVCIPCGLGCQSFGPSDNWKAPQWNLPVVGKKKSDEVAFGNPVRMVVIWKDAVWSEAGKPSTRGFGGRIYFYDRHDRPVRADGELIVYAFDDTDQARAATSADRKYVFRKEDFQHRYSKSDIGHSYSVWVPWDRLGGERRTIALLPMFKTADGGLVKAGQTVNVLPGTTQNNERIVQADSPLRALGSSSATIANHGGAGQFAYPALAANANRPGHATGQAANHAHHMEPRPHGYFASQAGHFQEEPTDHAANVHRTARTTTIEVPRDLSRRMSAGSTDAPAPGNPQAFEQSAFQPLPTNSVPLPGAHGENSAISPESNTPNKRPDTRGNANGSRPVFGQPGAFR